MAEPATRRTVSVVVPVFDNADSLVELHRRISAALDGDEHDVWFVDDGSTDDSWARIGELHAADSRVHGLRLARNYGQSQAVWAGFGAADGDVLVTIDADLENPPEDIPKVLAAIDGGADFASGWRSSRRHSKIRRWLPSSALNWLIRRWTGIGLHDVGCGLNAVRREVARDASEQGERRRHLKAALATAAGRTEEVEVGWARVARRSSYGLVDLVSLATDLLGFTTRSFAVLMTAGLLAVALSVLVSAAGVALWVAGSTAGPVATVVGIALALTGAHFTVTGMVGFYVVRTLHDRNGASGPRVAERLADGR